MSKQKFTQKIKKFFSGLTLGALVLTLFSFVGTEAYAFEFGDLFEAGDQGLSFTQYEGGVTQLDDANYDSALVESNDVREYILRIVNFALGFLGLIAVIIVIYGGVLYVTAAGEQERTDKGKKAITYAVIGLLIVLGSFAFVNTIIAGASGDGEGGVNGSGGAQYVVGPNQGGSFNALASEMKTIAKDIYSDYINFGEVLNEIYDLNQDLDQPALQYEGSRAVRKGDILAYLYSAEEKVTKIRNSLPKFSEGYTVANNLNRQINAHINEINSISSKTLVIFSGGEMETCSDDYFFDTVYNENFDDCQRYETGLYEKWPEIQAELKGADGIKTLIEPIRTNLLSNLQEKKDRIDEIHNKVNNFETINEIQTIYTEMNSSYEAYASLIEGIQADFEPNELDAAGEALYKALEQHAKYYELLLELRSVVARLRADTVSGNAPLIVTFDVLETVDPAGGSIVDSNVDWSRITGAYTYEGEEIDGEFPSEAVECPNLSAEVVGSGPAFRQCIFNHPGTYNVSVEIKSNSPDKYVPGVSTLTIKVNPPTTKINLGIADNDGADASDQIPVIQYYDNGIIRFNKSRIPVTLAEASDENGIFFDASATENVQNISWDFGDNQSVEGAEFLKTNHKYSVEGQYMVVLEVTNTLNQVDRKAFVLEVGSIAARIRINPSDNIYINQPIRFDSSSSRSSIGTIRGYEWSLTAPNGEVIDIGNKSSQSSFSYEFDEPGTYKADLILTNEAGNTGVAETLEFKVASQNPVARFTHSIPRQNQPGTVEFNASDSFDPDGDEEFLDYQWTISPEAGEDNQTWEVLEGEVIDGRIREKNPIIKFKKKGDYEIKLKVSDTRTDDEFDEITKKITIDNVLDVAWDSDQISTAMLDENGQAEINFVILSDKAIAYEIDFGDGETDSGDIEERAQITHTYNKADKYKVKVTVYDEDDNDNYMERRFFIGDGEMPIAKIGVSVDANEILDLDEPIEVSTVDNINFDASESRNIDGTGRDLNYQWDFGDTENSSRKSTNHKYDELSPANIGYYTVKLTVTDKDDPTLSNTDEIRVNVVNKKPKFSAVQGILTESVSGDIVTPVQVNMRVYNAEDEDGDIVKYKWWYFDVDDPEEQLGVQITTSPNAKLTIGTRGREGQELTYGFGLEITDNDGLTYSNQDAIDDGQFSSVEVVNGKNTPPTAKFNVNTTSAFVGDEVVFTSAATDEDGRIEKYVWDLEGDGFFNNEPTDEPTITHKYQTKNDDGYEVKLKVIDDKGGEAVSDPIKIFIDSNAEAPNAAFKYQVVDGSRGMKIHFSNTSTADTKAGAKIISYKWDFDTASNLDSADSNGDGEKGNDVDSTEANPDRLYTAQDTYKVKLTVTDNQGNSDEVINEVQIPLADPPKAAFKYKIIDGKVSFENNSTADAGADAHLEQYQWDFDLDSELESADSDGDGETDNDVDSELVNPVHQYPVSGTYTVKLTVIDNQGNSDSVENEINYTTASPGTVNGGINTPNPGNNSGQQGTISAILRTQPAPAADGIVYLSGNSGQIRFDFSQSLGQIAFYTIDKNILFDTNGDGIADNDEDFRTTLAGSWTTNFEKSWGRTIVRLTVGDIHGNTDTTTLEVIFR